MTLLSSLQADELAIFASLGMYKMLAGQPAWELLKTDKQRRVEE